MERPYPDGFDCVWLATDRDGHLGAFVTAGIGPIPVQALNTDHMPVEDIEEQVWKLPRVSGARLLITVVRPDDYVAFAERGLFVYDWSDVHRIARESIHAYELMAAPVHPITLDALPGELSSSLGSLIIRLDQVAFVECLLLDVHAHESCRGGE